LAKQLRLSDAVVIATSGTTSTSILFQGNRVAIAVITPSSLTGTSFTFQVSVDDSTYVNLFDEGSAYTLSAAGSRFIALKRQPFEGVRYLRIVSNLSESANRTIIIVNGEY
jgi:hypothetical protein